MGRRKKVIIGTVLAVVLLCGSLGGVALAADDNGTDMEARVDSFINKVCTLYEEKTGGLDTIDNPEALKEALGDARAEMRTEARENRTQKMLEEGRVTEEQLEAFQEWMESRPEGLERFRARFGHAGRGCFPGNGRLPAPAE